MENDIEAGLKKLNNLDDKLDSLNAEIMDNCKTLDDSEEKIRELLTHRTAEHISKAEPFFV
jgi:peptidoglycan hydrolase CwlO-like protein